MGFLFKLLFLSLHLIAIAMDIVIVFLFIRLIMLWKKIACLEWFDDLARELVNGVLSFVSQLWLSKTRNRLSAVGQLTLSLLGLILIRLALSEVARFLS